MTAMAQRRTPRTTAPAVTRDRVETTTQKATRYVWAGARLGFAFTFLWAFLDKVFGLGFATPRERSWLNGGSPTKGFLSGSEGPFAGLHHNLAGTAFANWAFMLGLLGIGVAFALGIGMRVAAAAGALLYVLMWSVVLPPETNPFLDEHLISAAVMVGLALVGAGHTLGLGRQWDRLAIVRRLPWLK
ncbi:DoxX family membrane protein [Asanoa sp. WMMD1127]|uniref:DoxX family membrane protein n=1 Tax=Asanoa sp. WMMD1127 TaxID=3016107 RepID=UPI002415D8D2|nr:DoxX family membrane protein [Asanoa sp. WMMD1127]MDG4825337.1 DoxX family membrane protein [Asanoa sp. WMMD1127]